ncbi:MAG: hypothetical protein ACR2GZ_03990 [Solirubrobacteraceae bacterium]
MSESTENPAPLPRAASADEPVSAPVDPVPPAPAWTPPAWTPPAADAAPDLTSSAASAVSDRPEIAVGAAFAGGLALALILKRLAR